MSWISTKPRIRAYFYKRISGAGSAAPLQRSWIRDELMIESKAQHLMGFEPTTSLSWRVHSTTVPQLLLVVTSWCVSSNLPPATRAPRPLPWPAPWPGRTTGWRWARPRTRPFFRHRLQLWSRAAASEGTGLRRPCRAAPTCCRGAWQPGDTCNENRAEQARSFFAFTVKGHKDGEKRKKPTVPRLRLQNDCSYLGKAELRNNTRSSYCTPDLFFPSWPLPWQEVGPTGLYTKGHGCSPNTFFVWFKKDLFIWISNTNKLAHFAQQNEFVHKDRYVKLACLQKSSDWLKNELKWVFA